MAVRAGAGALVDAGVDAGRIGCVVVATTSQVERTPAVAVEIAYRLGATNAGAFDLSAASAGFSYALAVAADQVRAGSATYVLVIGADRMSGLVDGTAALLFTGGAGAAVVGPSHQPGIGPVAWGSDGSLAGPVARDESWDAWWAGLADDPAEPQAAVRVRGTQVLRRLSGHCARVAEQALAAAGVEKHHLDAFIPHQACDGITDALVSRLALPAHVAVARDVGHARNTAGASIPLAMRHLLDSGGVTPGGSALLLGFGAGLTCAAQVIRLPVGRPVVRPTTRPQVLGCARDVIGELVPSTPVDLDTSFTTDLGADALFVAEVVTEMESRLGCRIPDEVMRNAGTVRDLVDYLAPEKSI